MIQYRQDRKKRGADMKNIERGYFTGERALFGLCDLSIKDSIFADGESPLKECSNIELDGCMFRWKYPLWYSKHIAVNNTTWFENARAGVWYTDDIKVSDCLIEAPKNFRRCNGLTLENVSFANAAETLWNCNNVEIDKVLAKGDYFAMNCKDMRIDGLTLYGNYCFDGAENVTISNSKLLSKDAFWNSRNITVRNSFISGEYLGWNAEDLTLIDCTIESLQGLCYIEHLTLKNCKLLNTTLAFEYSSVNADITGSVDSVLNPSQGRITADSIGKLTIEPDKVDPSKTTIICRDNCGGKGSKGCA